MTNKNRQPAGCATVGSDRSADANKISGAQWREFYAAYLGATPQARRMVCHLIQAYAAGADRRAAAWLYHWAAFIAIDPPAAFRVSATLRRVARVCMVVAVVGVMLALTACSGSDGSGAASFRATAQAAGVVSAENNGASMVQPATQTPPAPTAQPVKLGSILPTETPDIQPQTFAAQVVDATQTPTPQPAQIGASCDTLTPAPTIQLDDSDRAAGVVLRGQWQPCAAQTAQAVQP